jgi:hypothetical protein
MAPKTAVQTRAKEACSVCRSRKKKCDGVRPKCGSCLDVESCKWDNVTRKRGPAIGFKPALATNRQLMHFVKSLLEAMPMEKWPSIDNKVTSIQDFPSDPNSVDLWYYGKLSLRDPTNNHISQPVETPMHSVKLRSDANLQLLCDATTAVIKEDRDSQTPDQPVEVHLNGDFLNGDSSLQNQNVSRYYF